MKPWLALLLLSCGCVGTPALPRRPVPYHVAIMPIRTPTIGTVIDGELPGSPTALRLAIDPEELTGLVAAAVGSHCFTKVTLLDAPTQEVDAFDHQLAMLRTARACNADLLVELGLSYDPEVYRDSAPTFWLNFPLFFFASPTNWFLKDNRYYADVNLVANIYDRHALEAGDLSLGDPSAKITAVNCRATMTSLDFIDRSDSVLDYLISALIPSGYLATESAATLEEVRQNVAADLRRQVIQGIHSRRRELLDSKWVCPIVLDPNEIAIRREGAQLRVQGRLHLHAQQPAQRMDELTLDTGLEIVPLPFQELAETVRPGYRTVTFDHAVPYALDLRCLRMACSTGSRDRYVRTYTFDVPR